MSGSECVWKRKHAIVLFGLFIALLISHSAMAQEPRLNVSRNLFGSVPQGSATNNVLPLSVSDAIDRALKYNLGPILSEQDARASRAERLRTLSDLLPKVSASVNETVQQVNLAAFGFSSFPGVPSVIGPFNLFDARARYSQTVVDFKLLHELRPLPRKSRPARMRSRMFAKSSY